MAPITTSVEIARPAADVFDYAADPTRFNRWQNGVVGGQMDQTGTPQVGARCLTTRRIGGKNRSSTLPRHAYRPTQNLGGPRD